jgi:hypothetical protein
MGDAAPRLCSRELKAAFRQFFLPAFVGRIVQKWASVSWHFL